MMILNLSVSYMVMQKVFGTHTQAIVDLAPFAVSYLLNDEQP